MFDSVEKLQEKTGRYWEYTLQLKNTFKPPTSWLRIIRAKAIIIYCVDFYHCILHKLEDEAEVELWLVMQSQLLQFLFELTNL